ncbi:MAG: hypothetical protein AAF266_11880 [Planctomycetota bacterium]
MSRSGIFSAIRSIPADQGHSIFFYYFGHGYYNASRGGSLLAPVSVGTDYIRLSEIRTRLLERAPKLLVTVNDSCSTLPPAPESGVEATGEILENTPVGQALFFEASGRFHLNSSAPNQYALAGRWNFDGNGNYLTGSPFSAAFSNTLYALDDRFSSHPAAVDWKMATRMIHTDVDKIYRQCIPDGQLRLRSGKVVSQSTQTVRGFHNGRLFIGGEY